MSAPTPPRNSSISRSRAPASTCSSTIATSAPARSSRPPTSSARRGRSSSARRASPKARSSSSAAPQASASSCRLPMSWRGFAREAAVTGLVLRVVRPPLPACGERASPPLSGARQAERQRSEGEGLSTIEHRRRQPPTLALRARLVGLAAEALSPQAGRGVVGAARVSAANRWISAVRPSGPPLPACGERASPPLSGARQAERQRSEGEGLPTIEHRRRQPLTLGLRARLVGLAAEALSPQAGRGVVGAGRVSPTGALILRCEARRAEPRRTHALEAAGPPLPACGERASPPLSGARQAERQRSEGEGLSTIEHRRRQPLTLALRARLVGLAAEALSPQAGRGVVGAARVSAANRWISAVRPSGPPLPACGERASPPLSGARQAERQRSEGEGLPTIEHRRRQPLTLGLRA